MRLSPIPVLTAATAVATLAVAVPAHAQDAWVQCYPDNDGDGYAATGSSRAGWAWVNVVGSAFDADNAHDGCGAGLSPRRTDCDDTDADVHPFADEDWDYTDNDCDGRIDEPELWSPSSSLSGWFGSDRVSVLLTIPERHVANKSDLRAKLDIEVLDGSASRRTEYQRLASKASYWNNAVVMTHRSLKADTVYRIRLSGLYDGPVELRDADGDRYASSWHYVMTRGTSTAAEARHDVVTAALYEYQEQLAGHVGYAGSQAVDGTRYGASAREAWCSEFYSDAIDEVAGWGARIDGDTTTQLESDFGSAYSTSSFAYLFGGPGDWVHMPGHTAMFLERDGARVWIVEGNNDNEVNVRNVHQSMITGIGLLDDAWL